MLGRSFINIDNVIISDGILYRLVRTGRDDDGCLEAVYELVPDTPEEQLDAMAEYLESYRGYLSEEDGEDV